MSIRSFTCATLAVGAVALSGYGLVASAGASNPARVIDIYSSLPMQGASSAQTVPIVHGIRLALAQAGGIAGLFKVRYTALDDSTAVAGRWDPTQAVANARRVGADPRAVYYIGEFNSGASEVSIPILNQAGIPQVSPTNSYVGLTTNDPGSAPGEPEKFYPTGIRTYLRISARDTIQAAALLATMKRDRCRRVAIANDREAYGYGLSILMRDQAHGDHVRIVSNTGIDPTAHGYGAYARHVNGEHADCFMFAGIVSNNAIPIVKAIAAASPQARLYGGDGICTASFTDPSSGGIPATLGRRFKCTVLPLSLGSYPGGRAFLDAYRAMYGVANPDPYAIYGYEAMKLGLDTIAHLGASGNDRRAIVRTLFATRHRHSVLGTYSFTKTGDTTLRTYGVYRVAHGVPTFLGNAFAH